MPVPKWAIKAQLAKADPSAPLAVPDGKKGGKKGKGKGKDDKGKKGKGKGKDKGWPPVLNPPGGGRPTRERRKPLVLHCFTFLETGHCARGGYKTEANPDGKCPILLHVRAPGLLEAERQIRLSTTEWDVKRVAAWDKWQNKSAAAAAWAGDGSASESGTFWDGDQGYQEELPEAATPGVSIEELPGDWATADDYWYEGEDLTSH